MSDSPAAQPLINSAVLAVQKAGLYPGVVATDMYEVMVSDNPFDPNYVLVTLHLPGPILADNTPGAPPVRSTLSFTVDEATATSEVTAVAAGGI